MDDRMADWIAARIKGMDADKLRRNAATVGVVVKGELVAGMAVSGKERGNCEITFAADTARWATRETIAKLMAWPFVQMDCHRVTCRCARSNERAIRFCKGIGFSEEGVMREGWGDEDCIILGLLRSESPNWMMPPNTLRQLTEKRKVPDK